MSNIYIQEPPTSGKVILHTTVGPIDVELWSKETPKACRNFIQLCLEGYYDNTIFHRLVKGMCVQGGDPTGTGEGGESIYGKPFRDEFHSRLRFVRRGLVAMASGGKDDNGSQFFFTLGACPHLNNKHTIFGKVAGDTVYNMLKLDEGDTDDNDRPEFPQKIRRAEVVDNPFTDIQPRRSQNKDKAADQLKDDCKKKAEKAKKDFKLLSFGDEAEEEEEELTDIVVKNFRGKSKSSHDLLKDDKTLSSEPAFVCENESRTVARNKTDHKDSTKESGAVERIREKIKDQSDHKRTKKTEQQEENRDEEDVNVNNYFEEQRKRKAREEIDEIRSEYKKLKKEMKGDRKKNEERRESGGGGDSLKDSSKLKHAQEAAGDNELLASFFAEQASYSKATTARLKKANKNEREAATLAMLERFKAKLHQTPSSTTDDGGDAGDDKQDTSWLQHELRFEDQGPILAKDASTQKEQMYDITDPRHPLNARKRAHRARRDDSDRRSERRGSRR